MEAKLLFIKWLLARAALTEKEITHILSLSISKKLKKKDYLLSQGNICHYECFVAKGCLRLFRVAPNGDQHILRFAVENWWIRDQESIDSGLPSKYNINALENSEVLLWQAQDWNKLVANLPVLRQAVEKLLAKNTITNQNRIYDTLSASAEEKYEAFIKNYPDIFLRVPVYMIASYLGVSSKTLTRIRMQAGKPVKSR